MSRNAVFFAADERYFPVAWAAAKTVAAEPGRNFDVLILTQAADLPAPPGCRIIGIDLPATLPRWPCAPHCSVMSYARLAAPELWLAEYERAVYLDSDISIHGSLAPLFALDLRGAMAAMVEDCGCYLRGAGDQESWNAYRAALGLDPAAVYFNAGMMLMDLKAMRATRLWSRTEAFMAIHGAGIIFMDQDALNVLAAGQIAELSPRWNFMTHFLGLGLEAQMQPRIFHYADVLKPWRDPEWRILYGWQAPRHFARLFRGSPWAGYVPRGLYARWPLPWQSRAAAQQAQHSRRLTPEYVAAHVAHYRAMAAQLRGSVGQGFREAAAAGRYIDASPPGRR